MTRHFTSAIPSSVLFGLAVLAGWAPGVASQGRDAADRSAPVRYTALAVRTVGVSAAQPIEITVDRWTSDAEHEQLYAELMEGSSRLLVFMQKLPGIGRLSTAGSVGFPLKYARRVPRGDGAEDVTIITDREMSFWEVWGRGRSTDYPFMLIEFHLDSRGEGTGQALVATQLAYNQGTREVVAENFESGAVRLQGIRRID